MFVKCDVCENDIFELTNAYQIDASNFRVYGVNDKVEVEVKTIQYAKCINCGHIMLPSTSMVGKNSLAPEVKLYGKLFELVKEKINRIKFSFNVRDYIDAINNSIKTIFEQKTDVKEDNVKTTKRSKKDIE